MGIIKKMTWADMWHTRKVEGNIKMNLKVKGCNDLAISFEKAN
jgi:hypothetical protein